MPMPTLFLWVLDLDCTTRFVQLKFSCLLVVFIVSKYVTHICALSVPFVRGTSAFLMRAVRGIRHFRLKIYISKISNRLRVLIFNVQACAVDITSYYAVMRPFSNCGVLRGYRSFTKETLDK